MRYTVAHLLSYALATKSGTERAKFMARVLNTADEINLSAPTELATSELSTIFSFEADRKYEFEKWAGGNTAPRITVENIINCFDCEKTDQGRLKERLYRHWDNAYMSAFNKCLKELAANNGVLIAGRVRLVL